MGTIHSFQIQIILFNYQNARQKSSRTKKNILNFEMRNGTNFDMQQDLIWIHSKFRNSIVWFLFWYGSRIVVLHKVTLVHQFQNNTKLSLIWLIKKKEWKKRIQLNFGFSRVYGLSEKSCRGNCRGKAWYRVRLCTWIMS